MDVGTATAQMTYFRFFQMLKLMYWLHKATPSVLISLLSFGEIRAMKVRAHSISSPIIPAKIYSIHQLIASHSQFESLERFGGSRTGGKLETRPETYLEGGRQADVDDDRVQKERQGDGKNGATGGDDAIDQTQSFLEVVAQDNQRWIVSQWRAGTEEDPVGQIQHLHLVKKKHSINISAVASSLRQLYVLEGEGGRQHAAAGNGSAQNGRPAESEGIDQNSGQRRNEERHADGKRSHQS